MSNVPDNNARPSVPAVRTATFAPSSPNAEPSKTQQFFYLAVLWVAAITLLGFVAFGISATLEGEFAIVAFPFYHPHDTWIFVQMIAVMSLVVVVLAPFIVLSDPEYRSNRAGKGRHEIENFREKSPYGDASLAQREQIARALQMHNEASPKFEE